MYGQKCRLDIKLINSTVDIQSEFDLTEEENN